MKGIEGRLLTLIPLKCSKVSVQIAKMRPEVDVGVERVMARLFRWRLCRQAGRSKAVSVSVQYGDVV